MEPWVHEVIKNSLTGFLYTLDEDNTICSTPVLLFFQKGLIFTYPLRFYDKSYSNVITNSKATLFLDDPLRSKNYSVKLKGKLKLEKSKNYPETCLERWIQNFPFISSYIELEKKYLRVMSEFGSLSFTPNYILATTLDDSTPIEFNLEIL